MGAGAHAPESIDVDTESTPVCSTSQQTGETDADADRVAQVYRHSDGYPASVLRGLAQLKVLLDATRAERGPEYTAAAFVFLDRSRRSACIWIVIWSGLSSQPADLLEPANMEHLDQPLFLLGHGVENPADGIYGDEK